MLRTGGLLLVLRGRLRWQAGTLTPLTRHYSAKKVVAHTNGRRGRTGRGTGVLRGARNAGLGSSASSLLELAAQQDDLLVISTVPLSAAGHLLNRTVRTGIWYQIKLTWSSC